MPNKAKKLAVLECLEGAKGALGLPDLLALLPTGFAERSVRRWLAELVDEGAVAKSGRKRGTRYRAAAAGQAHAGTPAAAEAEGDLARAFPTAQFSPSEQTATAVPNKAKKLAVLECLQGADEAIGLPDLLALLPAGFAERSVRRWLAELVDEGAVAKSGRKRGTRYRAVSVVHMQTGTPAAGEAEDEQALAFPAVQFSPPAQTAIAQVRQPIFLRRPVAYNPDWLASYQPNQTAYFRQGEAERLVEEGARAPIGDPAGTYARRIYNRLLIDLSHHSSRLEGNSYSLLDTERLVIEGQSAPGKLDVETAMILNHKEAIRQLVEQSVRASVNVGEVLTLHYLLADGLVASKQAGAVRDHAVRIGASTYIPYEDSERLERELRTIASKAAVIENPYEQALFLLVHLAYLQAFADVNKRTSRLCANIPLLRRNLVPLAFNAIEQDDYASAVVAIYELNEPRPLAELFVASYLRTCAEYDATVEASGFDAVRVRYRQERRAAIAEIVAQAVTGSALTAHAAAVAARIPATDRDAFAENLREDLAMLSPTRIAGIGITVAQLKRWLAVQGRD